MFGVPTFATVTPSGQFHDSGPVETFTSPDGLKWAALLVQGDVERNGNWVEIVVGSLRSLQAATESQVVARFFTHSLGDYDQDDPLTVARANRQPLQWLPDSKQLALLWTDGADRKQIYLINTVAKTTMQLTKHPTSIIAFATQGETFLFLAKEWQPATADHAQRDPKKGVTIETRFLPYALAGDYGGDVQGPYSYKWHLFNSNSGETRDIAGLGISRFDWTGATFSRDGKFALVEASPERVPQAWSRYKASYWSAMIERALVDRNDLLGRQLMQLYAIDVEQAKAWPLWDAPGKSSSRIAWSPDNRAVALSPTFVPASQAEGDGLTGYATAVIDLISGRFRTVAIAPESPLAAASLAWIDSDQIEIWDQGKRSVFRYKDGEWSQTESRRKYKKSVAEQTGIALSIEEDMNSPPVLVATDSHTKQRRVVLDPNPQLIEHFNLGRVETIRWSDQEGRQWIGRLNYPVNWQRGRRYPLVIQTAGYASPNSENVFSLYGSDIGPGLGPGVSVLAAQPLAGRGMMVLSAERKSDEEIVANSNDAPAHSAAYESAIDHLDKLGLIDRAKVGISGYSNTGYLVQYALVHSSFQYAAAITDDNYDGSYFQSVVTGSKQYESENGAAPYGEGLLLWLKRAPGFNADKIRTPLRLQATSPPPASILASWEMFTRLRDLGKPVEFFLVPQIERGSHGIQNPGQCLASQEGAVDWFDFWLNGREDPDAGKLDQYARWRELRKSGRSQGAH